MQYKVPQNVEREDRIVGPLTLKQVIICTIGFGLAYTIYVYLGKKDYGLEISIIPVLPISLLTVAIAFIKINDIPFTKWALLLIEYWLNSQRRVWVKGSDTIRVVSVPNLKNKKDDKKEEEESNKLKRIHSLSKALDSADFSHVQTEEKPIDKVDDNNLLHHAFIGKEAENKDKHAKLEEIASEKKENPGQEKKAEANEEKKEIGIDELNKGGEIKIK